jgi:hypothetical protein
MLTKISRNYWKPGLRDAQGAPDILRGVITPCWSFGRSDVVARESARDLVTLFRAWPLTVTRALQGAR